MHCGVSVALMISACAEPAVDPPPPSDAGAAIVDAGLTDSGLMQVTQGVLELGVGDLAFSGVTPDQSVGLTRGPQGLQHLWVAVRIRSMSPERAIVSLSLTRDLDGQVVSSPFRVRLPFSEHDGYAERVGLQLVIPDPNVVLGQYATLRGEVVNREAVKAESSAHVVVFWEDQL